MALKNAIPQRMVNSDVCDRSWVSVISAGQGGDIIECTWKTATCMENIYFFLYLEVAKTAALWSKFYKVLFTKFEQGSQQTIFIWIYKKIRYDKIL